MKRTRFSLLAVASILLVIFSSLFAPQVASASSTYDDVIHPVSSLRLKKDNSNLIDITTSYGADIQNADSTAYTHFHDCIVSSTCKYALIQQVSNAAETYYKHQGYVFFIYAMDGVGSINFDNSGPYGSSEAKLSRPSGGFDYIVILLNDSLSGTDRRVSESLTATFPVANTRPQSGDCYDAGGPTPGYYCGHTNDLGDQGTQPFLSTFPVTYPSGYEGEEIPTQAAHAKYVAMGDSFSSGEGNSPFEPGTDYSGIDECHRSSQAYPRLLQADSALDLGATAFVACSGATTHSVLYGNSGTGNWNEGPQVNALSEHTEVVTLTIGGNDVGFKEYATACTVDICNFSTTVYDTIVGKIDNDLPWYLDDVYEEIASRIPTTANVYVVGYPHIAPETMPTGIGSACWPLNGGLDDSDPSKNDGAAVYDVVTRMNDAASDAIGRLNDSRFHFVDPDATGSPFAGHDWCEQDRYFDILTYNNIEYSFHPNQDGQVAYADLVRDALE